MTCLRWEDTRAAKAGYLENHSDAERRIKAGQRQRQCRCCGRHFWADEAAEHHHGGVG